MTPEELQEVVAAVIAALKTNGKTIDQLTAVTSLADTDNLEISNGKKVSFGKLKELVAATVTVSAEEIKGWEMIESTEDLPEDPTQVQQEKAYVLADVSTMYVYVGFGGDTLSGKYQSLVMKGEKGDKGDNGVHLGDVVLVNDLITGGEESALTAEMGKVLNEKIPILEENSVIYEIEKFVASDGEIDIVAKTETPTLDSVAYENKTYRQIFEGSSTFLYDAEQTFVEARIEEYFNLGSGNSITPVRQTSVVDSGEYSLYCHAETGKSSCMRQTSQNAHRLALNKTYYIACRLNVTTLPSENRCGIICESAYVIEQYGTTDGWESMSNLYKNTVSSNSKLYFGLFGGVESSLYLDSLVCVPTEIFTNAPTKAQFDELYATYIDIKKNQASGEENTTTIIYAPESVPNYGFTDLQCMQEFMSAMNAKAVKLGMTDSTFSNPYGGDKYGYNWTTVEDMMKMMVYATSYPRVLDYMSQNTQVTFQIYGNNARSEVCPLTANSFLDGVASAYTAKHGSGSTMPYQALSHKGAGWGDLNHKDATSKVRGCVGTAIVGTHHVAYCVFQAASAYQSSGTYYRAIVDLLDICKAYFDGGDTSGMDVSNYNYAMAVELPTLNPECYKNNLSLNTIYLKRVLSNGEEVKFNTASAIKVLAMMVMLDALGDDLHQVIDVNSYDEDTDGTFWSPNDSEPLYIYAGDKLTLGSSMYGILWWSNGVITLATARKAGGKMLYNKMMKGITP